ncbi:MAG: LptF/LptG family permease, partial [Phycisphaerales bacterium]|nr:LptF/LptG family permease [Phycisphaerales bacterium]
MILWRHTLGELLKLILVTTLVLVTVIAFAAAIKPLAEGKLGPVDTLRFMALAVPPMLQYALPFAAGFGATLAFHRIAQENEVIARYAGGISHGSVLAPALACGVLLAGTLALLNEQIIPRFLRQMEVLITEDLTKILVNS